MRFTSELIFSDMHSRMSVNWTGKLLCDYNNGLGFLFSVCLFLLMLIISRSSH